MHQIATSHFKGKSAAEHLQAVRGENHGAELTGRWAAATEGLREVAVALPLIALLTGRPEVLAIFVTVWALWKGGMVAWSGWSHLERLHRIVEEERIEIERNRDEERRELEVLYSQKGFEGKLLSDVVDVLMADRNRLLRVMVEEEMGMKLGRLDHPLQVAAAATGSVLLGGMILVGCARIHPGLMVGTSLALLSLGAIGAARRQGNRLIPAVIWNMALALLLWGVTYYAL
jgi:vacuolar iron transporter family protein